MNIDDKIKIQQVDFALSWEWEYDDAWVQILSSLCRKEGLTFLEIRPDNFGEIQTRFKAGELSIKVYLDRAGDVLDYFYEFNQKLHDFGTLILNQPGRVQRALDKATMHLEFITAGIHVPFTVILSPYDKDPELRLSELEGLGRPFVIKPANGGGGLGVVKGAEDLKDVIQARQEYAQDKYLLQKKIIPQTINGKRAWFRTFYVGGKFTACWWDDQTHIYEKILPLDQDSVKWKKLKEVTKKIAKISELDFFSSEIAIDEENKIVVVDYVNEPCDLRLKSIHPDGAPDEVVLELTRFLLVEVKKRIRSLRRKQVYSSNL